MKHIETFDTIDFKFWDSDFRFGLNFCTFWIYRSLDYKFSLFLVDIKKAYRVPPRNTKMLFKVVPRAQVRRGRVRQGEWERAEGAETWCLGSSSGALISSLESQSLKSRLGHPGESVSENTIQDTLSLGTSSHPKWLTSGDVTRCVNPSLDQAPVCAYMCEANAPALRSYAITWEILEGSKWPTGVCVCVCARARVWGRLLLLARTRFHRRSRTHCATTLCVSPERGRFSLVYSSVLLPVNDTENVVSFTGISTLL